MGESLEHQESVDEKPFSSMPSRLPACLPVGEAGKHGSEPPFEAPKKEKRYRHLTINERQIKRDVERDRKIISQELLDVCASVRPRVRADCASVPRPCPFVGCPFNLYLNVDPKNGHIKFYFPDMEPGQMTVSCAADAAELGGLTLDEMGELMAITRERVRQTLVLALIKWVKGFAGINPEEFTSDMILRAIEALKTPRKCKKKNKESELKKNGESAGDAPAETVVVKDF